MPDPVTTPTPATPEPTPTTPEALDDGALLSSVLGLTKPEEKDVKPPAEAPKAPEPEPAKTPEPPKRKVTVSKPKEPAPKPAVTEAEIEEIVSRKVAERTKAEPAPKPAPEPEPTGLTDAQRDELDLVRYVEAKDPARKGLSQQFTKFYEAERKFIEQKIESEGADYDPSSDPSYRKFLAQNSPRLTPAERQKFVMQRVTEEAETRATEKAKRELMPELEQNKRKLRELEERPKIEARMSRFGQDVESAMPEDVVKFLKENNHDLAKAEEAFPEEFPIVRAVMNGAVTLGEEFLAVRAGLKDLDTTNPVHKGLVDFVESRAQAFVSQGGPALIRNGKRFVPPSKWSPKDAANTWTFDDEDVLNMLKLQAQREAKTRVDAERKRVEAILAARGKRSAAASAATPPPVTVEPTSPKIAPSPSGGVASTPPTDDGNLIAQVLGIGGK